MKDLWINKWRPSTINEVIGNKSAIKKINEWILNFDTNKTNSLIISGLHGIGKTLVTKLLLDQHNYYSKIIYPDDLKGYRNDNDFVDFYNFENSIKCKVNIKSVKENKIALLFDETEAITLTSERKFILSIYKTNQKKKLFPLIFISNNNHSKLINDLKKYCTEVKFYSPSSIELVNFIVTICKKEKIKILEKDALEIFIDFSQRDIRRLLNLLQEFSYNYNVITNENIKTFITNSIKKNEDIGLYDASLELINNFHDNEEIYRLYETEKVLLPLMIHENYYKKILQGKDSWENQLEQLMEVSDSISKGDNIETSIYTDQNWYLQNIHGYYTCINTSYWINKSDVKLSYNDIKFSADLNKTSLKNINKKNINNLLKIINKKSIFEILMLCQLTNQLFNNDNSELFVNTMKSYKKDINIKDIELCLKINKTIDFLTLSTKEKKSVTAIIENK